MQPLRVSCKDRFPVKLTACPCSPCVCGLTQAEKLTGRSSTNAWEMTTWARLSVPLALAVLDDEMQMKYNDHGMPLAAEYAKVMHDYYIAMRGGGKHRRTRCVTDFVDDEQDGRLDKIRALRDFLVQWRLGMDKHVEGMTEKEGKQYIRNHLVPKGQLFTQILNDCDAILEVIAEMRATGRHLRLGSISSDPCERVFQDLRAFCGDAISLEKANAVVPGSAKRLENITISQGRGANNALTNNRKRDLYHDGEPEREEKTKRLNYQGKINKEADF